MGCFVCRPDFWSKFIALFDLVTGAGVAVITGYFLQRFILGGEDAIKESADMYEPLAQYLQFGYTFLVSVVGILLGVSVLTFVMAFVLFIGAHKRDYKKLNLWLIYSIAAVGVVFLILLTYGGHLWSVVGRSFVYLISRGTMIWSVYVDLKELEGDLRTDEKKGIVNHAIDMDTPI